MKKTNAMRILDGAKIKYETASYEDDREHELSRGAAQNVAQKLGIDGNAVFKTIVFRTDTKEVCVFCVSAPDEVNLKKARAACGAKEVSPVKPDDLLALTGYIRGGCSPVGMKKKFRTFIDETAMLFEKVYISAGVRGQQIIIAPQDLVRVTEASVCDLAMRNEQ